MYTPFLFIGGLGGWEVLLIVTIVMLLFGAKKLPELARGMGTGIREFKSSISEPIKKEMAADEPKQQDQAKPDTAVVEEDSTTKAPVNQA